MENRLIMLLYADHGVRTCCSRKCILSSIIELLFSYYHYRVCITFQPKKKQHYNAFNTFNEVMCE